MSHRHVGQQDTLLNLLSKLPHEPARDHASWIATLKFFPWLIKMPEVRRWIASDGVDLKSLELRGGARRYTARPARDGLHLCRRGTHGAEAARWTNDLQEFELFALESADRVDIPLRELKARFGDRAPAYREWLRALYRRVPDYALVIDHLPSWPANVVIDPATLKPAAPVRTPQLVTVSLPAGAGRSARRSSNRRYTYLVVPPGHAAAAILGPLLPGEALPQAEGAPLRRLVLELCREQPPSDDEIRQRRRRKSLKL